MLFTVRPLTQEDEPFVWEMLYQAIYVPEGQAPPPRAILQEPALARYAARWGSRPGDLGFLALDGASGIPAGAAWLRLFAPPETGYGFVREGVPELSAAVLPQFRGQGAGSLLLSALLREAGRSYPAVSLSVSPGNPAVRLYQRLGFEPAGERDGSLVLLKTFGIS